MRVTFAAVLVLLASAPAAAQGVRVDGLAYDSVRGKPMGGALVAILGAAGQATADANGHFRFEGVVAGRHTFVLQHSALDSIGLSGLSRVVEVVANRDVVLAVPSFQSLWRAACGREPPNDSGFVYGTIRDMHRDPAANAFVDLTWVNVSYGRATGIRQRSVHGQARTGANGGYVICGVPMDSWVRVDAATSAGASGRVDLPPSDLRVRRRDLMIGAGGPADSGGRGTIVGVLRDQHGKPFADARIVVDDTTEVRSGADGRFTFRDVRSGTRQVEILAIGMLPIVTVVDIYPRDTVTITHALERVTTLDAVQVTASSRGRRIAAQIVERQRQGRGRLMEAEEISTHATLETVFASFPGATTRRHGGDFLLLVSNGAGGQCAPAVWVDGARSDIAALNMMRPAEVTAVEFFSRESLVPLEFTRGGLARNRCGAVAVWTTWAMR